MISFITHTIDNPWSDNDICKYETNGSQQDIVQYNSYYNWRIKLTDKDLFLCSLKTYANDYKNIYLFAVTRRLFYFSIFVPQFEIIRRIRGNDHLNKVLSTLPLMSQCIKSVNRELELSQDVLILDCNCLFVKVNAPIDSFLFPRMKSITNKEILKKYSLLNKIYFQAEREFEALCNMIEAYDSKVKEKIDKLQNGLKRILIKKGVRLGISATLAGLTGGVSIGLDALFGLSDIADISDVMDIADMANLACDSIDVFDICDIADAQLFDFNISDIDDLNILDTRESDELLSDSYNISFGYAGERQDDATVEFLNEFKKHKKDIDIPVSLDHNGSYVDRSYNGGLTDGDKGLFKDYINKAFNNGKITEDIKNQLLKKLWNC